MHDLVPRQNPAVAWRNVNGAAALVTSSDSTFYWLNPVATRIWELADGERSVGQIGEQLVREFDVDLATCVADAARMVDEFGAKGLFEATR